MFFILLAAFCGFWVSFWAPADFEEGPKITFFAMMLGKTKKNEPRNGTRKNMKFMMNFVVKMEGFARTK